MVGGLRYCVCCDDCGVDAVDEEYLSLELAEHARDWATQQGGWLWLRPRQADELLLCPDCAAVGPPD